MSTKILSSLIRRTILVFLTVFITEVGTSQNLAKFTSPLTSSTLYENSGNIGLGITTGLYGKFHVRIPSFSSTLAALHLEVVNGGVTYGIIQNLITIGSQNYGIYQWSPSSDLLNYFKDPVKIGFMKISQDGSGNQEFVTDNNIGQIKFSMTPGSGPATIPLSISVQGIRVNSKTVTDEFQLLTGAGENKILASDASGNGIWTDVSRIVPDAYWLPDGVGGIYTNNTRVGIGTDAPSQKLEIVHEDSPGGIVINQISKDSTKNNNEIKFSRNGTEQWALGNCLDNNHQNSFFIWNPVGTVFLINGNNGNVGINNTDPQAKLDINGDLHVQDKVGIGCVAPNSDLYKLFVEGGIEARDIKVTISTFPDYVFAKDFDLMSISELDDYISTNKHLPGIPSAQEVKENKGFEVGDMQVKLVKKIEEQTLYIIDLQKQIDELIRLINDYSKNQGRR